jgi:hypothetical protein
VDALLIFVVVGLVVLFVSSPLWRPAAAVPGLIEEPRDRAELETAREAKYREIRDAELDHRMGKLSDADYEAVDASLRAEAVEILRALDTIDGR